MARVADAAAGTSSGAWALADEIVAAAGRGAERAETAAGHVQAAVQRGAEAVAELEGQIARVEESAAGVEATPTAPSGPWHRAETHSGRATQAASTAEGNAARAGDAAGTAERHLSRANEAAGLADRHAGRAGEHAGTVEEVARKLADAAAAAEREAERAREAAEAAETGREQRTRGSRARRLGQLPRARSPARPLRDRRAGVRAAGAGRASARLAARRRRRAGSNGAAADPRRPLFSGRDKGPKRDPIPGFDDVKEPRATFALDGHFMELNPAFTDLVGYSETEFKQAVWPPVMDRANLTKHREQMKHLLEGKTETAEVKTGYVHAQGLLVPLEGHITLVRGQWRAQPLPAGREGALTSVRSRLPP